MSRRRRIGLIVGLALLFPLLALGVGLTLLVATEGGARWTLGQLDRFGVEVERAEGRLLGPLDLHGVAFRSPTLEVEVERASLRWAPRALLSRQMSVEALHVEGLHVVLAEAPPPPPDEPAPDPVELPEIDLPVAVNLASLRIDGMRLERLGAEPLELELAELTGSLAFREGELHVRELALRDPLADLELAGTVLLRGDYPLDLSLGWRADIPGETELPPFAGSGAVTGSVADLSSRLTLTSPAEVVVEGGAAGLPGVPTWWVTASAQCAALAPFLDEPPLEWVSLEADARGGGGELALNLAFQGGHHDGGAISGTLALEGSEGVFALEALALRAEFPEGQVAVEGRGRLAAQDGGSAKVELDWSLAFGELPTLVGRSGIDATQSRIRTETLVDAPFPARLVAGVDDPTEELRWSAELEIPDAFLPAIDPEWPELRLAAGLSARGDLTRIESSGRVNADLAGERFALALQAGGDLEASRFTVDELTLRPEAGGLLSARADVDLAGDEPRFDASGEWSEIARALAPEAQVLRSEAGSFSVSGTAGAWAAQLGASVQLDDTPEVEVRLEGRGSDEDFLLDDLTLSGEGVAGAVRGRVAWSPVLAWDLVAEGVEVDLVPFQAPVGGRVSLALLTAGALEEEGPQATLEIPVAVWEEDERRVELQGAGGLSGDTVRVEALDVRSGPNRLHLAGVLDDQWALTWRVEAPDLSEGAGLEGRVMGEGSVSGPLRRPMVQAALEAEGVALVGGEDGALLGGKGGPRLDRARLDATVDLADSSPSHVRVEFVATPAPGAPQVEGSLTGEGFLAGHRLKATAALDSGEYLDLVLSGALELPVPEAGTQVIGETTGETASPAARPDAPTAAQPGQTGDPDDPHGGSLPRWHGELLDLQAGLGAAGEWALEAPASLRLSPQALALSLLCLGSEGAEACVEGVWSPEDGGEGRADLRGVELERFAELLPPGLVIQGVAGLNGEFAMDPEGRAFVRAQGAIEGGRIRHPTGFGTEEERIVDEAELHLLVLPEGRLEGDVALRLDDGSFLLANLATNPDPAGPATLLSGDVAMELQDRGLLAATSEELWNSSGVVRGALTLGGTAEVPLLSGEVALEEGRVEIPEFGLRLEGLELRATDDGPDAWRFTGDVRSGPGSIALEGSAFLPRPHRPGSVRAQLSGRDFQALDSSLGRVRITPSLRLQADAEGIDVEGTVRVPWAQLTPGDVEGMVARSPDVVVVGLEEEVPARAAAPPGLAARIRVEMGDSVSFDGFGVEGRITGAVTLVEEPGRLTTGQGEFRLVDGTFTAARQRLTIERGRLIFSDRPIEDPGLDLRITRQTRDILAIMEVRGTALEPEVTVFSDPVLSQADAMAYLLIGRPVRGTGERDGDLMEEVATSMGLAGGAAVLDRIGPSLGLAEARIERGETLTDAALVVGTYVTPRLFVSYGLGLFEDAVSTLRIRYEITDRWSFRTESGRETGADLLFSRER